MGPAFAGTTKEGSSNGQTVIASEAKQSISRQRKYGLLRRFRLRSLSYGGRAAPRNDVVLVPDTTLPSRREAPEALMNFPPKEGVGNAGCPLHPQPRVRFALIKMHTSKRVHRLHPTFPHAMVLRLITCSPRRSGSFATVALRIERFCPARLSRTSLRKT